MRPTEVPVRQPDRTVAVGPKGTVVRGWGGGPGAKVSLVRPDGVAALRTAVEHAAGGAIARGKGRSYGDAAQLSGGLVLDTTRLWQLELDSEHGVVTAHAGATIGDLLDALVPAGWMVPVVPGTQHVTVGGAIASDIHGKNHGVAGTFGRHVESISLLTSTTELIELLPGSPDRVFEATLGGMGLTGVIVSARIRLRAVGGPLVSVDTDRVDSLDAALAALATPGGAHRVAWLDLLSRRLARGIVTRAEHTDASRLDADPTVRARATVPRLWPEGLLRPPAIGAFNALRYRTAPRHEHGRLESIGRHLFPLDSLDAWPRLYGPPGLLQYQFAVPAGSERVLEVVIERLRRAHVPCYLATLKDFGAANDAPLSFPLEGWTLALDLPRAAPGIGPLLDGFDQLVAEVGGRVYLTKDARLRPEALRAMYPRLDEWRSARNLADPARRWRSDLARRTGLL
jgi:decaprenylphospho-beta-D-ribofuranose 2-oxidase